MVKPKALIHLLLTMKNIAFTSLKTCHPRRGSMLSAHIPINPERKASETGALHLNFLSCLVLRIWLAVGSDNISHSPMSSNCNQLIHQSLLHLIIVQWELCQFHSEDCAFVTKQESNVGDWCTTPTHRRFLSHKVPYISILHSSSFPLHSFGHSFTYRHK
jgi:hypothetical protein